MTGVAALTGHVPALAVHAAVPERGLAWDLDVAEGTVVAIVGPNGAGKSSLLRAVTGALRPATGTVAIAGEVVSGPGMYVPVHRRRVALLEQRPLLLPHLDVLDNVAFGLRAKGVRRGPARARAAEHLAALGCAEFGARRSWELSGGEAQRVAIARALATEPRLLLLDEPMAALDVSVAPTVRSLLREVLSGDAPRTGLLVTHDVIDALTLADRLVLVDGGRIAAQGPVEAMLARPRRPFLADLVGVNLLAGTAAGPDVVTLPAGDGGPGDAAGAGYGGDAAGAAYGGDPAAGSGTNRHARVVGVPSDHPLRPGRPALATFPPVAVSVHLADPGGSPRNHLGAVVAAVEPRGTLVRVTARLTGSDTTVAADVTAAAAVELDLRPGLAVRLVIKATQVTLYER